MHFLILFTIHMTGRTVTVMADLDKVLKGLACGSCTECPYMDVPGNCENYVRMDAIELLKSQQELIAQYESKCQTCKSRLDGVKPF